MDVAQERYKNGAISQGELVQPTLDLDDRQLAVDRRLLEEPRMEAEAKRRRDWKGERELVAARIDDPLAQDLRTLADAQGQSVTEVGRLIDHLDELFHIAEVDQGKNG